MSNNILESTLSKLDNIGGQESVLGNEKEPQDSLEGVYVFISVDLVNSTIFKTRFAKFWPFVIQDFYKIITDALGAEEVYRSKEAITYIGKQETFDTEKIRTGGFKVWKLVGDEVLIYHKIVSVSELINTVRIMDYVTQHITEYFIRRGEEQFAENDLLEFKQIAKRHLFAKTTMWVARCGSNITLNCPNMYYDSSSLMESTDRCLDFLGPDIDAGFRLCECAEKGKVVISPNLVALLSVGLQGKNNAEYIGEIKDSFRIVTYIELDGIWEKRLYPVFMYCNVHSLSDKLSAWRNRFEYDEKETSKLAGFIFDDSIDFTSEKYSYDQLEQIYRDLGRDDEIQSLKDCFNNQIELLQSDKLKVEMSHNKFEFHLSCLCVNVDARGNKKIWIHNHPNHGLSFGCIRINVNHDYREFVIQKYEERYNIKIEFDEDFDFIDMYAVNREGRKEEILGLIVMVNAKPKKGFKTTRENGWYNLNSVKNYANNKKRISNFDTIIDKVLKREGQ